MTTQQRAAVIEEVEFLLSCGEAAESIAGRLGYSTEALEKRCYRAERPALGAFFGRANCARQRAKRRSRRPSTTRSSAA